MEGPARPITVAPFRLASWTAIEPTPPAAPVTTTVSPGLRSTARTMAHAVKPATGIAPATSQGRPAWRARFAASATTYSAWLDRVSTQPITSSPGANVVTSGPSRSTTPAKSLPCPEGNVAGQRSCSAPSRIFASPGLMPAALTLTRTSPRPGSGTGTSRTSSTSTGPYSSNRTAFIVASGHRFRRSGHVARPPSLCPNSSLALDMPSRTHVATDAAGNPAGAASFSAVHPPGGAGRFGGLALGRWPALWSPD